MKQSSNAGAGSPAPHRSPVAATTPLPAEGLLRTKLYIPPPRPDLVPRPRLLGRLEAGLRGRLTLLAAPAGSGKTTLLSAWRAQPSGSAVPLAWVSLDAGDNDPVRFLGYLAAALDALDPGIAADALALLRSPRRPPETILTALLNALAALPRDAVLVLDDYHAIEAPDVHRALAALLEHLPPRLHLVVSSREDPPLPLARLRARGELLELRAADLRFTPAEAAAFLTGAMGLPLTAEQVAALGERTEGWAAGLQLAALSLRGRQDAGTFIEAFAGSHRHLVDYLVEEVLERQPAPLQAFLLETAILERLCGPLCDAVTGRDGGQATLERLEAANLFLVPLDDARRWYRYHRLFADFLRARLVRSSSDRVAELHGRAATWHERSGLHPAAIGHALAARDVERAARLVGEAAEGCWKRGELTTLLGWLEALPADVVQDRPRVALAHAWTRFLLRSYDGAAVEAMLARIAATLGPRGGGAPDGEASPPVDPPELGALRGVLAAIRAAVASAREDAPRTIALAQAALALLPQDQSYWRLAMGHGLGLAHDARGEALAAGRALADAIALAREAGDRYLALVATMNLARVRLAQGQLQAAAALCQRGLDLAAEQGGEHVPVAGSLRIALGRLRYEWNDLPGAARRLREGVALAERHEHWRGALDGYAALAWLAQAEGDEGGARAHLARGEEAARALGLPHAAALTAAYRARLAIRQG
ncbi:MAG TPA: tetratricopeptide repeat protein, partial [Vicinamibacteria bacterium]